MIDKDELLFVVDKDNNPTEPKPRSEVHSKGYWHRVSHIWVINYKKQILCQKRSLLKDKSPGKWQPFFGGHLNPNEGYLDGAVKEFNEELGLNITKGKLSYLKLYKQTSGHEFQAIYYIKWDGDIKNIAFEREEIDLIKWLTIEKLKQIITSSERDNWGLMGYESSMLEMLEKTN